MYNNNNLISADEDGEYRAEIHLKKYDEWVDYFSIDSFISDVKTVFKPLGGQSNFDNWIVHDEDKEEYIFIASYQDDSNWCEGSTMIAKLDYNSEAKAAHFKTIDRIDLGGNVKPDIEFYEESEIEQLFSNIVNKYKI